jgi:hypothetical protein
MGYLYEAFDQISDRFCWFLYTFSIHLYMHIFRHIFLSNYWWQESDIWSQASYRYAILWEAFGIWWVQKRFPRYGVPIWSFWPNIRSLPSIVAEKIVTKNVYFCALAHSSSCFIFLHLMFRKTNAKSTFENLETIPTKVSVSLSLPQWKVLCSATQVVDDFFLLTYITN